MKIIKYKLIVNIVVLIQILYKIYNIKLHIKYKYII